MADATFNPFQALPAPRSIGARWWTSVVRFFAAAPTRTVVEGDRKPPKPYVARRSSYLVDAAMKRAMERL